MMGYWNSLTLVWSPQFYQSKDDYVNFIVAMQSI
jgi:hypothetical protein